MSGGSLDYFYSRLEVHIKDFGDKELNDLVADLAVLFHDREWFLSGDTGEGHWNESRDAFKAKWFTEHGRQERIEKYLEEFAEEVRQTFGISIRKCQNCLYWKPDHSLDGTWGSCEFVKSCLMHRSESCAEFVQAEVGHAKED